MKRVPGEFLGVRIERPKVGFFELSSCEGCQLQLLNREENVLNFLSLVEVVAFREGMTDHEDNYEIAFVEGSVTRDDEIARLEDIRKNASMVIAFGSCACFGGVNQLKNRFEDAEWVRQRVYGDHYVDTREKASPIADFIDIDLEIYGCPVRKKEVERIVSRLVLGKAVMHPAYPVCMECQQNENICLFELGEPCLGPVTRAGCDSWCPSNRMGCWGCRGPAPAANFRELAAIFRRYGIPEERMNDRLECFGGFQDVLKGGYRYEA